MWAFSFSNTIYHSQHRQVDTDTDEDEVAQSDGDQYDANPSDVFKLARGNIYNVDVYTQLAGTYPYYLTV
jgi:hypothetical protein